MTATKDDIIAAIDVPAALGLLSRLPVPVDGDAATARGARAAWAWPVAGLIIAGIAGAVGTLALWLGVPPGLAAALVLTTQIVVTGAMHEDGLADSADGLWGGWSVERRLEIMKDSRIGAYGVIALVLGLLIRWQALTLIADHGALWPALLALGAGSRAAMVVVMGTVPPARPSGLSRNVGQPPAPTIWLAVAIAVVAGALTLGSATVVVAIVVGLIGLVWARIAKAKIGGQTGDILGSTQNLTEIAGLLTLSALWGLG